MAPLRLTVGEGLERLMVGPFTSFGVRGETHEPHPLEFFFIVWGVGMNDIQKPPIPPLGAYPWCFTPCQNLSCLQCSWDFWSSRLITITVYAHKTTWMYHASCMWYLRWFFSSRYFSATELPICEWLINLIRLVYYVFNVLREFLIYLERVCIILYSY